MQSRYYLLVTAFLALAACSQTAPSGGEGGAESGEKAVANATPAAAAKSPGARLYLQCRACHTLEASGAHGVGPNLHGVVGAKAGAKPGYQYSAALTQAGIVWTPEKLDAFLAKPNAVIPGTKMAFSGVSSAEARQDLIAYLQEDHGK